MAEEMIVVDKFDFDRTLQAADRRVEYKNVYNYYMSNHSGIAFKFLEHVIMPIRNVNYHSKKLSGRSGLANNSV